MELTRVNIVDVLRLEVDNFDPHSFYVCFLYFILQSSRSSQVSDEKLEALIELYNSFRK